MNILINIHKNSPDVVVIYADENIARTTMTKEELIEVIRSY
jgi:hypothetical protein